MVQQGTQVKFFIDNWLPHFTCLREYIQEPLKEVEYNLKVADLRNYNAWNLGNFSVALPSDVQQIIKDVTIFDNSYTKDRVVWGL